MNPDDIPSFADLTGEQHSSLEVPPAPPARKPRTTLPDALDELEAQAERGPDLVGLNFYECVNDLVRHPELLPRVRKIVGTGQGWPSSWPQDRIGKRQREVIAALAGRLHFPETEGRVHHMPAGNPAPVDLPSKWWITNLDYRKVLTGKLRGILQDMKERGLV